MKPELEEYRKQCAEYIEQPEDVLSYALFPQVAEKYFQYRQAQSLKLDNSLLQKESPCCRSDRQGAKRFYQRRRAAIGRKEGLSQFSLRQPLLCCINCNGLETGVIPMQNIISSKAAVKECRIWIGVRR